MAGEEGLGLVRWLSENQDAPARRWDAVAREALGLLEEGGLTAARAAALFNIGSVVHRRTAGNGAAGDGAGSAAEVDGQRVWAVECLRLSRRLWAELGDVEGQLAATANLAVALVDLAEEVRARSTVPGEEQVLLLEAVDAAEAGLITDDPVRRGQLAMAAAQAIDRLDGGSERAVRTLERLRGLVDDRITPEPALEIGRLLAAGYAELGWWPQARDTYAECLRLRPGRSELARHAAYALVRCGEARAAVELLEGRVVATAAFPIAYVVEDAVILVRGERLDVFEGDLQPVVEALLRDGEERLTLVPTGPAALHPWAAAKVVDPATGETAPFGEVIVLSQAPSAAMAELCRRRANDAGPGPAVVFADPVRGEPGNRAEAAEVEGSFGGRARVLLAEKATREAVLRELPDCRYAHLACPGSSTRLLLTGGDVTVDDVRALPPLRARLVFLSGCRAAPDGLPFELLRAGAAAVVSTLWPVDDRVMALLAGSFYRELAAMRRRGEPEDVALALQRSRLWLRTGKGFADPSCWAAFVLHGS